MNKKINEIIKDIKSIKIQGATSVCKATLDIFELLCFEYRNYDLKKFEKLFFQEAEKISRLRPTEPMARNAFKLIMHEFNKKKINNTKEAIFNIKNSIENFRNIILKTEKQIILNGGKLINKNDRILTHCHSSIVEKILISQKNKKISVYNTETRPLMQGHITSKKLVKNGIKTTMIVDSAADFFLSPYSGDLTMDKVIIGCDAISIDGSAINKIGSYGVSLSCKANKIPFYITGTLLKFDSQDTINIEIRNNNEIWKNPSEKKLNIINVAFDYIPKENITGIICEFGIIKPSQVNNLVQKYYSWMFEKNIHLIP